jgi:plasmid stabilization system protein ParE
MKYRIRVRSRAHEDIRAARDWYERQSPGLGARFGEELDAAMFSIFDRPLLYANIHGEVIPKQVTMALTNRQGFTEGLNLGH